MKKLLEHQLKDADPAQRELVMTLMEKDPALLEKISKEMQAEIKAGKSQMAAAMKVLPKYQVQLQKLMGDKFPRQGGMPPGTRFNPNGSLRR